MANSFENISTVQEKAKEWGITARRISRLCNDGRIEGAEKIGGHWFLPKNAEKPMDGRTSTYRNQKTTSKEVTK